MSPRWRTFWRVFFMLEKPAREKWPSARMVKKRPELRHLMAPPVPTWTRIRLGFVAMLPLLIYVAALCGSWRGVFMFYAWCLESPVARALLGAHRLNELLALCMGTTAVVWTALTWGGSALLMWKICSPLFDRGCRRQILRRNIPICIRCGYEPGSWTDRCPECGRPIKPTT